MSEDITRRLKGVYVTADLIIQVIFTWNRYKYIELPLSDLPDSVRFVSANYVAERMAWFVTLQHKSFDVVLEGSVIPEIVVTFTTVNIPRNYKHNIHIH